ADRRPLGALATGFTGLLITSVALALTAAHPIPVVIVVFLLGLAGFVANPALSSRVFGIAPAAPTLAVAGNISAFNVGISVGPWLGGIALTAGLGYPAVAWIGACLSVLALALLTVEARLTRAPASPTAREEARRRHAAV
ncbi:MAG: MFS transporter, partial [Thermobispora bispora]|nr:MFS transporter [Thermobispora bispora]